MAEYRLTCGGASAAVLSRGGELASYLGANGRQYIWKGDPDVWAGHGPVLFPVVGTTIGGKVRIEGREYEIPKHGYPRKREFALGKHGEDFVEYVYEADEDSLKKYPFRFRLHVVHSIREDGFDTTFLVENLDARPMPFCIGGHPGFCCPIYEGERFEDYILRFEQVEDGENTLAPEGGCITGTERLECFHDSDTLRLDHGLFDPRDALIFDGLRSRTVWLLNEKTGRGLRFRFPKFDALGVWTAPHKNAPYVCLEPWAGLPALQGESGNFEDKPYVRTLAPGMSYKLGYGMDVVE